jgi:Protein of unknown function (DUF2591)
MNLKRNQPRCQVVRKQINMTTTANSSTGMVKVLTKNLIREGLDFAVAKCQGANLVTEGDHAGLLHWPSPKFGLEPKWTLGAPNYSTDWTQGGPIIDREKIDIEHTNSMPSITYAKKMGDEPYGSTRIDGPTPLIAATRCYVANKLGHEIEIPTALYEAMLRSDPNLSDEQEPAAQPAPSCSI